MDRRMRIFKAIFSIDFVAMLALAVWLFYQLSKGGMPSQYYMKQVLENLTFAGLYFANLLFFYPKLANKYWGVAYLAVLVFIVWLAVVINLYFGDLIGLDEAYIKHFSKPDFTYRPNNHWTKTWITVLSAIMLGLSYVSSVAKKLQKNQLAFEVSEKERVGAELAFLKAQINPHFFFNTLHTIYALMDTNIPSAKSSIYSLSHMMRYVLYETQNEKTLLSKEVEFIEDYIALMKVRIAPDVQVIFEKQTGFRDLPIAPMLFLPFVENAFKHGISAVHPSYVYIELFEKDKKLVFGVRNSLFVGLSKQLDEESGIGILNTKRRLDLMYPGKYELITEKDDFAKEFVVTLTLNIDEH
ncbi:sensor histidine kinase [Pedobacter cryotolerans]|uniref:Sensor histidine kinase n=1 Tax=Pedobacter cryotolerans TaxID=2571270 RepID=A0A4U1C7W7_9SPHI|nr:sensor histidine kinase [Pedobacter cryotolerans]TKC01561.1 sensor histidine kinase [Pedobacter cryotolerans]